MRNVDYIRELTKDFIKDYKFEICSLPKEKKCYGVIISEGDAYVPLKLYLPSKAKKHTKNLIERTKEAVEMLDNIIVYFKI